MKIATIVLAASFLCCSAASSRAAADAASAAADAAPACQMARESALAAGRVSIRPGETLCIRLRVSGQRVDAGALVSGADAAGALVLKASKEDKGTLLVLKNPLGATLRYRVYLSRPMRVESTYTSSCPITAHGSNFESWPYAVGEIVLSDFELLPADSSSRCD